MVFIGLMELICLIAFPIGAIWFFINLFKKKNKKKPALIMILSFVCLIALVMASDVLYHDELELSRIERESRESEDASKKIKELEKLNEQLEEKNKKLEKENKKLERDKKIMENAIIPEETTEKNLDDNSQSNESTNFGLSNNQGNSQLISESEQESHNENLSEDNDILSILKKALGDKVGDEAYDILINQIGFTNLEYIENIAGTGNYTMSSSECNFILTAFPDDKVYRIFQPNGGAVFYEDDTVKMTVEELKNKTINYNDRSAYYIIAKEIVKNGLKSPRSSKFPSIVTRPEEIAMSKNGNIIAVQSYVDAENSFGATIRSKWTVQFELIDISTYSYNPLYVNVDGEILYGEWIDME